MLSNIPRKGLISSSESWYLAKGKHRSLHLDSIAKQKQSDYFIWSATCSLIKLLFQGTIPAQKAENSQLHVTS